MVAGRDMLNEMHDMRVALWRKNEGKYGSLASEYYGKGFKIKAEDLIMMNVPEKLDFLAKKKQYLK